jgi:hypothetical protein
MFGKRVARFHGQAQQELELIRARHRALTEELIGTLTDVQRVLETNPTDAEAGYQVKYAVAPHGSIPELLVDLRLQRRQPPATGMALLPPPLADAVPSGSHARVHRHHPDRGVVDALQVVLAYEHAHGDWLPPAAHVDLAFASEQWQRTVLVRTDIGRRAAPSRSLCLQRAGHLPESRRRRQSGRASRWPALAGTRFSISGTTCQRR